jgi:myo-inositol 2-dehydrogenase / D-chiro-inositol 1-dehydrogenase
MNTNTQLQSAQTTAVSRRNFLKQTSLVTAGSLVAIESPFVLTTHAQSDQPIRIGLIGCGGRGTGAALDALGAATNVIYPKAGYHTEDVSQDTAVSEKNVKIVALADAFPDRLERCRTQFRKLKMEIPDEACFVGFDAYKKLLAMPDINYVILAQPPHFRPAHLKAAIEAGKNVFMEKPVAVDAPGVRMVIEAGELAKQKKLGIGAGTQRRHLFSYRETIQRLRDGAVGELLYGCAYWNGGVIWVIDHKPEMTDMEWQLRNWNYFTWLGGDHIVEQHVHNLDVMNWVLGTHPVSAYAMGGRQARPNKDYGHIYDHFAVEYEYPNGVKMFSQCRQIDDCTSRVGELVVGTKGSSNCQNFIQVKGGDSWRFPGKDPNAYRQEHVNLINSIRAGTPINEARTIAESTMTGIIGRESAYSGQLIKWDDAYKSEAKLGPAKYEMGPLPFPEVAIPGKYQAML